MGIAIVSQGHQRLIEVIKGGKHDAWVVDRVDEAWWEVGIDPLGKRCRDTKPFFDDTLAASKKL